MNANEIIKQYQAKIGRAGGLKKSPAKSIAAKQNANKRWADHRRKPGSKNREKQRIKVALIHERVANIRNDFQHKLSTKLIRENQAVAIETLDVTKMQQNRLLARAISDAAWSSFVKMLEYKARWNGKTVLKIGRFCGVIMALQILSFSS